MIDASISHFVVPIIGQESGLFPLLWARVSLRLVADKPPKRPPRTEAFDADAKPRADFLRPRRWTPGGTPSRGDFNREPVAGPGPRSFEPPLASCYNTLERMPCPGTTGIRTAPATAPGTLWLRHFGEVYRR
jgi:hypothetical protein